MTRFIDLLSNQYAGWREDYLGLEQFSTVFDSKVVFAQQIVALGFFTNKSHELTYAAQKLSALEQWNWQCVSAAGELWEPLEQSYLDFTRKHAVVIPFIKAAPAEFCKAFIHRCVE